jgi:endogenous inhibitor of DNA gyrase (YacG/DUF329 family)
MIRPLTCPICGRELPTTSPTGKSYVPFCSERCRLVDFHRWWQGRYAIIENVDLTSVPREGDAATDFDDDEP